MAEPGPEGPFGDLGSATYDGEEQEWYFARDPHDHFALLAAVDGESRNAGSSRSDTLPNDHASIHRPQGLLAAHLQLRPGKAILPALLEVSKAVTQATAQFDVAIAARLSLGYIYDYGQKRAVPIIVSASGAAGSSISIVKLQQQRQGWHDSRRTWLQVPVPSAYTTTWNGPGTPVQQLLLARTTESIGVARFLAARFLDRSVVFRLELTRDALSMQAVHEISKDDLYSVEHMDVAFNPWYSQQYAIIDTAGNWKVWQLETNAKVEATCVVQHNNPINPSTEALNDGWRKIMWVGSPTMLAICSRMHINLYGIENRVTWLQDIDVGPRQADCWILDVVVNPELSNVLVVLTGTHVLAWVLDSTHNGLEVRQIVMLRHHGNQSDLSMRLHVQPDGDGVKYPAERNLLLTLLGAIVLVRSSMNELVLCYKFNNLNGPLITIKGPASVNVSVSEKALDIVMLPVQSGHRGDLVQSTVQMHVQQTLSTYQVFFLKPDFELGQQLFCTRNTSPSAYTFRRPDWTQGGGIKLPNTVDEPFILYDDHELETTHQQRPVSRFVRRLRQTTKDRQGPEWTIDLSLTARDIANTSHPTADIGHALDRAEEVIRSPASHNDLPLRLLRWFGEETIVSSVDEDSTMLQRLLAHTRGGRDHEDPWVVASRLAMPQIDGLGDPDDLSSNYDQIIAAWMRPLPTSVSGRVRLAKEALARQMTAEVTLASHVLRIEDNPPDSAQAQEEGEPQPYEFNLPIRNMPVVPSQGQRASTQPSALPTPSPTATPSILTQASQSSAYAPQKYHITAVTTFTKPLPISLPRSTQRVLRHWEVGADPATYEWRSYSRRITRQTEIEDIDSQLTEEERARLQRKAERLLKRERKEAAATREQQALSSQMPELIVSASQPVERTTASYSQPSGPQLTIPSSQSQPVAASQAVQGRYGGRPAKKKRKQGF